MNKKPEIGKYIDNEEKDFITSFEQSNTKLRSFLTKKRKEEIKKIAYTTIHDERQKISLRVPKKDLADLKSRAMQEGISYQTLINSVIHRFVSH